MRGYLFIFAAIPLLSACRKYDTPRFADDDTLPNVTIGDLRDYYGGNALTIADDIVIAGRVVSSDKSGNFYNTFFIDDGTGAVEIMAGMPDLHAIYHSGQRIVIRARGLAVGWGNGAMQMGLPPEPGSGFATGYFYHQAVIRRYVSRGRSVETVAPIETGIASLSPDMCGRLVRLADLTPDDTATAGTWATVKPAPATGYVKFRCPVADSVTVVTSGYASFASMPLPRRAVTLTGILLYGKGGSSKDHYLLKLRDEEDIYYQPVSHVGGMQPRQRDTHTGIRSR